MFGAMGSRLGTAVHTGTFRLSGRVDGVVGQNLLGASVLTLALSALLGLMAWGPALVFGIAPPMGVADFVVVSTVGGLLASVVVGAVSLGLAAGSVRFGWDLDNVTAPLVSTLGDLATVPALVLAATLADRSGLTEAVGASWDWRPWRPSWLPGVPPWLTYGGSSASRFLCWSLPACWTWWPA